MAVLATPALSILAALALLPAAAQAHGFVGQRFFPATLATDDPFVADELSFPTLTSTSSNADGETPATRQTALSMAFARRITPDFGLEFGANHLRIAPDGQPAARGWDNVSIGAKYQLSTNEAHESILSIGADWDVGGTGSSAVGAERFSTVTPTLYFGKGFGDLSAPALRPLAVTGTVGVAIPTRASTTTTSVDPDTGSSTTDVEHHPHVLNVGLALQYSLPYLQSQVKDIGLAAPFDRMIPIVEFTMAKPLDRVDDRRSTGTINPGVLWAGQKIQLGLEAVIPMNSRSGHGVGFMAQLHFFLDDLFPGTFGHPLLGGTR
ncbi:hypothetical protein HHL11_12960 [Ramlibacter sp. G-1-2-2]|uniref:Transporter n=2 Tax=Ramlibacter agri TaxID=2728837 RepID=A0A848HAM9_9BURK|nr:hypothetical protein [Ramlibacter agri]